MKKIIIFILTGILFTQIAFGAAPVINGAGLPGSGASGSDVIYKLIPSLIANIIKYIAVIAVISTIISGIMYLISAGNEDKTKKAKSWIIWSLVGVLLSISAWYIINLINTISIPNS